MNDFLRTFAGACLGAILALLLLSSQAQPGVHFNPKPEVPCYDPAPADGAPTTTQEVTP